MYNIKNIIQFCLSRTNEIVNMYVVGFILSAVWNFQSYKLINRMGSWLMSCYVAAPNKQFNLLNRDKRPSENKLYILLIQPISNFKLFGNVSQQSRTY